MTMAPQYDRKLLQADLRRRPSKLPLLDRPYPAQPRPGKPSGIISGCALGALGEADHAAAAAERAVEHRVIGVEQRQAEDRHPPQLSAIPKDVGQRNAFLTRVELPVVAGWDGQRSRRPARALQGELEVRPLGEVDPRLVHALG